MIKPLNAEPSPRQALAAANLGVETPEMGDLDKARCGILIGSAMGGMNTFSTAIEALHKQVP